MRRALWLTLLLVATVPVGFDRASGAPSGTPAVPSGRRLYREYCSSCHGIAGKGDGPDATIFVARPRNLREGFLKRYKTDELVRRLREGQPLELALDLPALRARALEVEALVSYMKRMPEVNWELAARGQDVFLDRCVECHGTYGRPGPRLPAGVRQPPDLSDPRYQSGVSDADLVGLVRHGRKGMPALTPRVSADDAGALAAFVRLLSPGFELYATYCTVCHGEDGRGPGQLAEKIRQPTVVFDRAYFSRRDPEELRAEVWHMVREEKPAMPHFRTLLDNLQARAIVEYLKRTD